MIKASKHKNLSQIILFGSENCEHEDLSQTINICSTTYLKERI